MRFPHGERERIIRRPRRLAGLGAQECRPRRVFGRVQRVAGKPHVQDHRVQSECRRVIEDRDELRAL
jgi:hypothetical protein